MAAVSIQVSPGAHESQTILAVDGGLTINTRFEFQQAWRAEGTPPLIIDLSAVPYVDSSAIDSWVNAYAHRQKSGHVLALAGVSDRVNPLLTITTVNQLSAIYSSLPEAKSVLVGG